MRKENKGKFIAYIIKYHASIMLQIYQMVWIFICVFVFSPDLVNKIGNKSKVMIGSLTQLS